MNRRPYDPDDERANGPDRDFDDWLADVRGWLDNYSAGHGDTLDDAPDAELRAAYDSGIDAQDYAADIMDDDGTAEAEPGRKLLRSAHVFHVSQTEPLT